MEYGMCPRDASFPNNDVEMKLLSYAKLNSFDTGTHGQFFWNFRTEFEPRWDFQKVRDVVHITFNFVIYCCDLVISIFHLINLA